MQGLADARGRQTAKDEALAWTRGQTWPQSPQPLYAFPRSWCWNEAAGVPARSALHLCPGWVALVVGLAEGVGVDLGAAGVGVREAGGAARGADLAGDRWKARAGDQVGA